MTVNAMLSVNMQSRLSLSEISAEKHESLSRFSHILLPVLALTSINQSYF